jgi:hypothetical protein
MPDSALLRPSVSSQPGSSGATANQSTRSKKTSPATSAVSRLRAVP